MQGFVGTILLEEPSEFKFEGGLFYAIDRIGDDVTIIRAMRPNAFFKAFRKAAEACQEYGRSSAEVIPFPTEEARLA